LSVEAARGELDVLVGREPEVEQLVDILGKRRANNPCLVGEPGVGKTAIVEGLAARWAVGSPEERAKIVIGLDAGRLLVGTHLRGSFSEKLRGLQDEVKRAEGKVLVFFDELHTLVGAGAAGEGALDAAGELKAALARGDFPCMGASTPEEFERHVARDPALERRFVPVRVEEPHPDQAEAMLFRILPAYAAHHGVGFTPEAVRASVRLSMRFIPEQRLPDKAIALLDLAGSRAARAGLDEVDAREVARLVAERTGVPLERLLRTDRERLLDLEGALGRRVVGHRRSLERIAEVIRRHAAGFGSHRPLGVFLLVGPSGVGKTETAKALAEILHEGDPGALVRFDLSEFSEAHAVARLVGAPPGYVGHDSGGQLTEAVRRRPGRVVLLDEIEKAHREVLQVLLSILDEGRLTDARGRTVSFAESVIILTSNLGSELASPRSRKVGFASTQAPSPSAETAVLEAARRALAPELWGRIDEKLYYPPLERAEVRRIARLLVAESSARLERERGIAFDLDARAIDALIEQGGVDAQLGARPLRRVLGHLVEGPIAARVLEGRLHAGERVTVTRRDGGGLLFRVGEDGASLSQRPTRRHVP
jgi:ATP-dependent Clp protease ATP-binding subunit ClpC